LRNLHHKTHLFKFRPSGHPYEYTLVVTYRSEGTRENSRKAEASPQGHKRKPGQAQMQRLEVKDACLGSRDRKVVFSFYSASSFGDGCSGAGKGLKPTKTTRGSQ